MSTTHNRCLLGATLGVTLIVGLAALMAQSAAPLKVVSSDRFEIYDNVTLREPLQGDKETVILAAMVSGLTSDIMNKVPLRNYFIAVGEKRYECLSLDIMPKEQRELVCRAPRTAKELVLHVGDLPVVTFTVTGTVKPRRAR